MIAIRLVSASISSKTAHLKKTQSLRLMLMSFNAGIRGAISNAYALASTWAHLNHQQGETWLRVKGEKALNEEMNFRTTLP